MVIIIKQTSNSKLNYNRFREHRIKTKRIHIFLSNVVVYITPTCPTKSSPPVSVAVCDHHLHLIIIVKLSSYYFAVYLRTRVRRLNLKEEYT